MRPCPFCAAPTQSEAFCPSCGQKIGETDEELRTRQFGDVTEAKLKRARGWLLFAAIAIAVTGIGLYFFNMSKVEAEVTKAETMLSAEQRVAFRTPDGMTWR